MGSVRKRSWWQARCGSRVHAPLERAGNWVDAILDMNAFSAPLARVGKIRSAGVTDLRFGSTLESDWQGRDRFCRGEDCRQPMPLPRRVQCYAIPGTGGINSRLLGDGLVPVESALGRHTNRARALEIPASHQWIGDGMNHLDLLVRQEVYERIAAWLAHPEPSDMARSE